MKMSPVIEVFVVAVVALVAVTFAIGVLGWSVMLIVSPFHPMPWSDAIRIALGLSIAKTVFTADTKHD